MTAPATGLARLDEPTVSVWRLYGRAQIDERPAVSCVLAIRADGTWSADLATFTLADTVDLLFVANDGGHFCGPASVGRSRADAYPLAMATQLLGVGPLLMAVPAEGPLELDDAEMVDGEVVS